jgi:hypothetical protein
MEYAPLILLNKRGVRQPEARTFQLSAPLPQRNIQNGRFPEDKNHGGRCTVWLYHIIATILYESVLEEVVFRNREEDAMCAFVSQHFCFAIKTL